MGTEWCVENPLRCCSGRSLHAYLSSPVFDFSILPSIEWVDFIRPSATFSSPDDDTAQYLSKALATLNQDQGRRWSATDVKNALEETRMRKETMELGFEDRVFAALSILGV